MPLLLLHPPDRSNQQLLDPPAPLPPTPQAQLAACHQQKQPRQGKSWRQRQCCHHQPASPSGQQLASCRLCVPLRARPAHPPALTELLHSSSISSNALLQQGLPPTTSLFTLGQIAITASGAAAISYTTPSTQLLHHPPATLQRCSTLRCHSGYA